MANSRASNLHGGFVSDSLRNMPYSESPNAPTILWQQSLLFYGA